MFIIVFYFTINTPGTTNCTVGVLQTRTTDMDSGPRVDHTGRGGWTGIGLSNPESERVYDSGSVPECLDVVRGG